jgi:hypothetical protein
MSYNNKLKSDITVAKVSIQALEKQLAEIGKEVETERLAIRGRFHAMIIASHNVNPFIPEKILSTVKFHISDSLIRPTWTRYDRPGYTSDIDIYYYSDSHYDNRTVGNHRWEISIPSSRFYINTSATAIEKQDNESADRVQLALGMNKFISEHKDELIKIHKEIYENENKAQEIAGAIGKLKRDISEAEKQMEINDIIRIFKPGGETAIYLMNKEIDMPTHSCYEYSRRHNCWFHAIKLVKETKKGVRVQFIVKHKDEEGNVPHPYVTETKVLTLEDLIRLYKDSKKRFNDEEERRKRNEEREAELKKQQTA